MYNNTLLVHYCVKQDTYDVCNMIIRTPVGHIKTIIKLVKSDLKI